MSIWLFLKEKELNFSKQYVLIIEILQAGESTKFSANTIEMLLLGKTYVESSFLKLKSAQLVRGLFFFSLDQRSIG